MSLRIWQRHILPFHLLYRSTLIGSGEKQSFISFCPVHSIYNSIIEAVANGANKNHEIASRIGKLPNAISPYVKNLISLEILEPFLRKSVHSISCVRLSAGKFRRSMMTMESGGGRIQKKNVRRRLILWQQKVIKSSRESVNVQGGKVGY